MKKRPTVLMMAVLLFHMCLVSGCLSQVTLLPREYFLSEVETFISNMDRQFDTLGFRGLHLGMTYDEVNRVVWHTPWGYMHPAVSDTKGFWEKELDANWPIKPQYKSSNFLKGDNSDTGLRWPRLCLDYPPGYPCLFLNKVFVRFFDGKLALIAISILHESIDEISRPAEEEKDFPLKGYIASSRSKESGLSCFQDIGELILQITVNSYGAPTKVYSSLDEISILSFKPGCDITLYAWDLGKEEIYLTMGEHESKYGYYLTLQNIEAAAQMKENQSKGIIEGY